MTTGHSDTTVPARGKDALPHSPAEDIHALIMGSSFAAFGLVLLKAAGLVTGGVAGIALMISYRTGWSVGALFVAINLPFFILAQRRLGWIFTLKSLAAMGILALFSILMPQWLRLEGVNVAFAAVFGGSLIGMGVLSLARHQASVGGMGIVALYLQERKGISAGLTQFVFDVLVVAAAFAIIDPERLAFSVVSALALSLVMFAYHRPGRYTGH
ncbi:YitT family protein [Sphingobium fuliginis]|nr:YitT family protein [Sphingobium fuliginis]